MLGLIPWLAVVGAAFASGGPAAAQSLWSHMRESAEIGDVRGVTATFEPRVPGGRLTLRTEASQPYAWATIPAPADGWHLARKGGVEATVANRGDRPVEVALWVVGTGGWESIADVAVVGPGTTRRFSCKLRATFPDGTPKLDPARVDGVRVMLLKAAADRVVEVTDLAAAGDAPTWTRPAGRIDVPGVDAGRPEPGRRVRYAPARSQAAASAAALLYLPRDWNRGAAYPVIVEYPGNIFFTSGCYSTGRPEQCVIGYGMSQGEGAIWLSLPFVDAAGGVAENGWGDPDATAEFCIRAVEDVCAHFGGDRTRVVLTGFSRGAIACGFIGLRNDRIAGLWRGFHCCQHYDGDGWNGATIEGAVDRARRFQGVAVFHTDNPAEKVQPVTDALGVPTTFASSGLGAHSCAMFLDDRPSTRQLREWFAEIGSSSGSIGPGGRPVRIAPE